MLAIVPEDILLVKWSRFLSTFLFLVYLLVKHKIYISNSFLLGFTSIVLTDLCLVYFDYFVVSILFIVLSIVGFGSFLWHIAKLINWKKITFSSVLTLVLLLCFKFYLLFFVIELVRDNMQPNVYQLSYFYAVVSIVFIFIAGLAYLQTEKEGKEYFLIVPFVYLWSNTFLGLAMYSSNYWCYQVSRFLYLITICLIAYHIVLNLYYSQRKLSEVVEEIKIKN